MVGFLNKVVLLLPQRTNIAQEQMVVACGEALILKCLYFYLRFSHASSFENALIFTKALMPLILKMP